MNIKLLTLSFILAVAILTPNVLSNEQKSINPEGLNGEYDLSNTSGTFNENIVTSNEVAIIPNPKKVLGTNGGTKRIEVDLTTQTLRAFEGDQKVYEFLISSGKWGKTPTGTFKIWGKFRYTKMEGGNKALNTYYYLPNVPFVMFFENDKIPAYRGFSLHGTYWHANFGHPMSHGCINMKTEDAGLIYNWVSISTVENPGTEIIIYGVAPRS